MKSVQNVYWKDWCWSWNSNTLATWYEELTHLKRPWCWERLKVGEGDNRGWDGWMASPTQWTWVWVNSGVADDREAWRAAVHGVTKNRTWLSNWTEYIHIYPRYLKYIYVRRKPDIPIASVVKKICLLMQETWVQSLGQEDPLEEGMVTHSSILASKTLWIEEPGGLQPMV